MAYYVRFKKDLVDENGNILHRANDNTKKTRYAIIDEGTFEYAVALKPNDVDTNKVCMFSKNHEGYLFDVIEE
jgi:hypothetical protein